MFFHAFLRDWLRPFICALRDGPASRLFMIIILILCTVSLCILTVLLIKALVSKRGADIGETRCPTPGSSWSSFRHGPHTLPSSPAASNAGTEQLPSSLPGVRPLSQIWASPQSRFRPLLPLSPTSPILPCAQPEPTNYPPMDVLPPEVFRIILQYFAPRRNASDFLDTFLFSPFPLRLVGKKWQSAVDQASELWKNIDMSLGKSNHDPRIFEWYQFVTQTVTSFDGITVRYPEKARLIDTRLSQHLFGLIVKSKAVTVKIPRSLSKECSTSPTLPDFFSQFPMRENVRRQLSNGPELEDLRRVEWHMCGSSFHSYFPVELGLPWSSFFALPWGTLTHVKLFVKMSLHDCLTIFNFASSMEKLSLMTVFPHDRDVTYPEPKTLNLLHLHSLTINAEVNLDRLFRSCHMPVLRKLKLELEGGDAVSDLHRLDVAWWELTRVTLKIPLDVMVVQGILNRLEAVERLSIEAKGPHVDAGTWSLKKHLPSLKTFSLSPDNPATNDMMTHVAQHILTNSIKILDAPLIHYPSIPSPNFLGFLRTIKLCKSISPQDLLSILSNAKHIDEGQFEVSDGLVEEAAPPPTSQPPSPIPLLPPPTIFPTFDETVTSNIRSLKLVLKLKHISGEPLLRSLTFPELVKFEFEASRNSTACVEFYRLLERSRCPLIHLSAKCHSMHPEAVLSVLGLVSRSLRRFEVTNSSVITASDSQHCFGRELFDRLVYYHDDDDDDPESLSPLYPTATTTTTTTITPRSSQLLCPHLEHLYIWPCVDLHSFRNMVSSRWTANNNNNDNHGCKKLEFIGAGFPPGDDLTQFEKELKEHRVYAKLEKLADDEVVYPPCDLC